MQIQTVPESFALPPEMTLTSKFKTIGNAVPVRLSQSIAYALKDVILAIIKGAHHETI